MTLHVFGRETAKRSFSSSFWPVAVRRRRRPCSFVLSLSSPKRFQSSSTTTAFDRRVKTLQRSGAARAVQRWRQRQKDDVVDYDYFRREVSLRLVDRLDDIQGTFPLALQVGGAGLGHFIHRAICAQDCIDETMGGGVGGVRKLVQLDASWEALHRDDVEEVEVEGSHRCGTYKLHADEESLPLPFPDDTFDLVLSAASLHSVNNLPGLFSDIKRVLKPDGCFLFAMVGGTSLQELGSSLVLAEMEREGGFSSHVGPFVNVSDVGTLLTNAGFTLPTVDVDTLRFGFPDSMVLMEHLQRQGEGNAAHHRRHHVPVDTFVAAACLYDELYSLEDEGVQASVQVIHAIGWTPHASQPKPLQRGSATHKMTDITVTQTKS